MNKLFMNLMLPLDVDLTRGVQKVTEEVTSTFKSIVPILFGLIAIFALVFTVFKGIQALVAHRQGQPTSVVPVILGAIATVICGLFSTAAFFTWFGV